MRTDLLWHDVSLPRQTSSNLPRAAVRLRQRPGRRGQRDPRQRVVQCAEAGVPAAGQRGLVRLELQGTLGSLRLGLRRSHHAMSLHWCHRVATPLRHLETPIKQPGSSNSRSLTLSTDARCTDHGRCQWNLELSAVLYQRVPGVRRAGWYASDVAESMRFTGAASAGCTPAQWHAREAEQSKVTQGQMMAVSGSASSISYAAQTETSSGMAGR